MRATIDLQNVICREAARYLGTRDTACVFVNGWRLDASRVTALVFPSGEPRPGLVAKVGRDEGKDEVLAERGNLEILARSTEGEFRQSVPHPHGLFETPEVAIVFESVVSGERLDPPRQRDRLSMFADRITDWVLAFHRASGARSEPLHRSLFQRIIVRPFEAYRQRFSPDPEESEFLERMLRAAADLEGRKFPLVFQHGDLCPANILVDGERLGVIDWETPFAASAPCYDLIHLFACLWPGDVGVDALRLFKTVFFEENPLSAAARRSLARYARVLDISPEVVRLLFTTYWLEYALEKAARAPDLPDRAAATRDSALWGLVRFGQATCLNVKWLAQNEGRLVLP